MADIPFIALLNHKGTKNHLLSDFCRIICDGIRYVSFGTISTVILNAIEILDVDIPREIMDHLPTEERKLVTTLSLNLYENSEMFTALVDELRSARLQGVSEDSDAESASVEAITLDWLLSEMKDDMLMKKSQNKSPCVNSHSNSQSHIDNPNNWSDSQSTILPSDSNSPTILYVGSPTSESLKPISQAIVQKPSLGVIASGVIEDVKTTLRSYVTEYSRLPTRDRVPGVLEVCSDTVKEAISLADTRIRYK